MSLIPTSCVDDFYNDPHKVRNFALSLDYSNETGIYPGVRSKPLNEIDYYFFDNFCKKIFSLFYNFQYEPVKWKVDAFFHKIYPYEDQDLNVGDIHQDNTGEGVISGLIYLNPDPLLDSGTSFYRLKKNQTLTAVDLENKTILKKKFFKENENSIGFKKHFQKHNSKFEKILEVKNVYNRMIAYPSNIWHGQTDYRMYNEPRLTQVFFVKELEFCTTPILRSQSYEL